MNTYGILGVAGLAVVLGAGVWYMSTQPPAQGSVSNAEDAAVRTLVTEFGTKLQFVPLLGQPAERQAAMELYYADYVAPETIALWAPEGAEALGRYTSSPWPERIEIVEVIKVENGIFKVEGNIIEVTSAEASQGKAVAAVQPVTLTVTERDGGYRITGMTKGAYSQIPHRQTIVGYWECLPKVGPGPHTMECAFGIAVDQSDGHYAVNTMLMSQYPVDYPIGTKVRVSGVVMPANQLSSNQWRSYDIDGIINATEIEKVQ